MAEEEERGLGGNEFWVERRRRRRTRRSWDSAVFLQCNFQNRFPSNPFTPCLPLQRIELVENEDKVSIACIYGVGR